MMTTIYSMPWHLGWQQWLTLVYLFFAFLRCGWDNESPGGGFFCGWSTIVVVAVSVAVIDVTLKFGISGLTSFKTILSCWTLLLSRLNWTLTGSKVRKTTCPHLWVCS